MVLVCKCETEESEPKPASVQLGGINVLDTPRHEGPFTVCFSGTGCTRDEGEGGAEQIRKGWGRKGLRGASDPRIYCPETGYIPVRIHREISGEIKEDTGPSVTVRGVGMRDWLDQTMEQSEDLMFGALEHAPKSLNDFCHAYSGKKQQNQKSQALGQGMTALALHGANLAASRRPETINFIGHSRGGVEAIMAAWFLYAYGSPAIRAIPVNIFAIDPVPGPSKWRSLMTQLPPNVSHYVGVYAWDHIDSVIRPLVPWPNKRMLHPDDPAAKTPEDVECSKGHDVCPTALRQMDWKKLGSVRRRNPLLPPSDGQLNPTQIQPKNYELFACRGRHSTVAGNATSDGNYDWKKVGYVPGGRPDDTGPTDDEERDKVDLEAFPELRESALEDGNVPKVEATDDGRDDPDFPTHREEDDDESASQTAAAPGIDETAGPAANYGAEEVKSVPKLVYRMARGYLAHWGVTFKQDCAVKESVPELRLKLNRDHRFFDKMGGGSTRISTQPGRPYVRRISSLNGMNPYDCYYMDNVVGDPPYDRAYPVTGIRTQAGWVKWRFL